MRYQAMTLSDGAGNPILEANQLGSDSPPGLSLTRAGAISDALQWAAGLANWTSVIYAINQGLEGVENDIRNGISYYSDNNAEGKCYDPRVCGALVHVILSKPTSMPIGQGSGPLSFVTLLVPDFGIQAGDVLAAYLREKKLLPGTPEGTDPVWQFLWVTLD